MSWTLTLAFAAIFICSCPGLKCYSDINDPKTNLDYLVRTIGSKDPNVSSVNYLNGSVFAKQPGTGLQKLFNFEGYNINRKLLQPNGSYLSLSREFVVYRDPTTNVIQTVWINAWTQNPNEVFCVANDPVNALLRLGDIVPTKLIPGGKVVFNTDVLLEYPNALAPAIYPKYSAGPVYEAAELFGFFANLTGLTSDTDWSVPMTGTWIRRSQYLPWMEMSTSKGELYYTTMAWKCKYEGLKCVAEDIMKLIDNYFPKYKDAPTVDEEPNETSWTMFKNTIDRRRKTGLPDIIIPPSSVMQNMTTYDTIVDQRILDFFDNVKDICVYFNGTTWSQITGHQSINLFNVEGNATITVAKPAAASESYSINVTGALFYRDTKTGKPLRFWKNPLTGHTVMVYNPVTFTNHTFDFPKEFVYSMDIAPSDVIALLAAQSMDSGQTGETWSVNILDVIFDTETFTRDEDVLFYGTAGRFSSWLNWMNMEDRPGNMAFKVTFYRCEQATHTQSSHLAQFESSGFLLI